MMGAFIAALALSVWKLYAFFPNKRLSDDDTTPESVALLEQILIETDHNFPGLDETTLYQKMQIHPLFDPKHFWRFNENRLRRLIAHCRFKDPHFRL